MSRMIQVRNVSDRLHRELTRRARARNQTLTDYVEEILEREVARPTREEIATRLASREPIELGVSVAGVLAAEREERERHLHSLLTRRRSASTS